MDSLEWVYQKGGGGWENNKLLCVCSLTTNKSLLQHRAYNSFGLDCFQHQRNIMAEGRVNDADVPSFHNCCLMTKKKRLDSVLVVSEVLSKFPLFSQDFVITLQFCSAPWPRDDNGGAFTAFSTATVAAVAAAAWAWLLIILSFSLLFLSWG